MSKELLLSALEQKAKAEYSEARATLEVYLNNSAGIGEHPQIVEEMDKLVDRMATAKDKLGVLSSLEFPVPKTLLNE